MGIHGCYPATSRTASLPDAEPDSDRYSDSILYADSVSNADSLSDSSSHGNTDSFSNADALNDSNSIPYPNPCANQHRDSQGADGPRD